MIMDIVFLRFSWRWWSDYLLRVWGLLWSWEQFTLVGDGGLIICPGLGQTL